MFDIAIIGSGPAGSTLSRLISKQFKILLIDKRNLEKPFENNFISKPCGGLISPDAQKMMGKLSLVLPQKIIVGPQLFVVRTLDFKNKLERYYQRFYFNVDREKLDRWFVSLIPKNVDIRYGCKLTSIEQEANQVKLVLNKDNKQYIEYAKILIGADGSNSIVRKSIQPNNIQFPKTYFAIQEWFKVDKLLPYFSVIFDNDITDFYSWTIPKNDYLIVGSVLPQKDNTNNRFELLKNKMLDYGYNLKQKVKREGSFIYRPIKQEQIFLGIDKIALVGESAGLISPSSAEGISYALKSACYLADAILLDSNDFLKHYKQSMVKMKINILLKNLKSPFMYNSLLRKAIMTSGLNSVKIRDNL